MFNSNTSSEPRTAKTTVLQKLVSNFKNNVALFSATFGLAAALPRTTEAAPILGYKEIPVRVAMYPSTFSFPVPSGYESKVGVNYSGVGKNIAGLIPNKLHYLEIEYRCYGSKIHSLQNVGLRLKGGKIDGWSAKDPLFSTALRYVKGENLPNFNGNFRYQVPFIPSGTSVDITCTPRDEDIVIIHSVHRLNQQNIFVSPPIVQTNGDIELSYRVDTEDFIPQSGTLKIEVAVHNNDPFHYKVLFAREISRLFSGNAGLKKYLP